MLEEPIIERIEKGPVEQVSDSTFGNRHILEVAASEQIGEKVAGVVKQVPLRLGGFVNSGQLASDGEEAAPPVSCRRGGVGGGEAVRAGAGPREERGGGGRAHGHGAGARTLAAGEGSTGAGVVAESDDR